MLPPVAAIWLFIITLRDKYMLTYIQGNRIEDLAHELGSIMQQKRSENFTLEPDTVIINNFEMGQWLSYTIADRHGICANTEFKLAGSFIWDMVSRLYPDIGENILTREDLKLLILAWLDRLCRTGEPQNSQERGNETDSAGRVENILEQYLQRHGTGGLYRLAGELAAVFDRYINFRWDMLLDWETAPVQQDPELAWQILLWQAVSREGGGVFKMEGMQRFLKALDCGSSLPEKILKIFPQRLFIFSLSQLPPVHLQVFSAMSVHIPIYLFVMNPCREYWGDIVTARIRACIKAGTISGFDDIEDLFPVGNRLLASLGRPGRAFLTALYELPFETAEKDLFVTPADDTLLGDIQKDIYLLRQRGNRIQQRVIPATDRSLLVASCYSPLREIEALHDHLLYLLDHNHGLYPHEIMVMAPDMGKYAPLVHAVFGSADSTARIPYTVGDMGVDMANKSARAFMALLDALESDFNAPLLMDIISMPAVMEKFELAQDDLAIIRDWIAHSGIKRGSGLMPDELYEHSWSFGLDRLFSSYAVSCDLPVNGVLPLEEPVEGSVTRVLGSLAIFFHRLYSMKESVLSENRRSLEEWKQFFTRLSGLFLTAEDAGRESSAETAVLNRTILDFFTAAARCGADSMSSDTVSDALRDRLSTPPRQRAFFSGRVIFSDMVPMRTLPFRYICLLGMNDADFPQKPSVPGFDIIAQNPARGDRMARDEDRYLFLETLLATREGLYISYVGRDEQDDSVKNPASVVSELLDVVKDGYCGENGRPMLEQIVTPHPLQPFSRKYLDGSIHGLFTYARAWSFPLAHDGMPAPVESAPPFITGPLEIEPDSPATLSTINPGTLAWFMSNPPRYFLKTILNVDLDITRETTLEDSEPFWMPDDLKWNVSKRLESITDAEFDLIKKDQASFMQKLFSRFKAAGALPAAPMDAIAWKYGVGNRLEKVLSSMQKHGVPKGRQSADFLLPLPDSGQCRILGSPGRTGPGGGLLEYAIELYAPSRPSFWTRHLVLCAAARGVDDTTQSMLINSRTDLVINMVEKTQAIELLAHLAALFIRGHKEPLPLFPKASLELAKKINPASGKNTAAARAAAWKTFFDSRNRTAGITDHWIRLAFRGRSEEHDLLDRDCIDLAVQTYGPMLDFIKKGR